MERHRRRGLRAIWENQTVGFSTVGAWRVVRRTVWAEAVWPQRLKRKLVTTFGDDVRLRQDVGELHREAHIALDLELAHHEGLGSRKAAFDHVDKVTAGTCDGALRIV